MLAAFTSNTKRLFLQHLASGNKSGSPSLQRNTYHVCYTP